MSHCSLIFLINYIDSIEKIYVLSPISNQNGWDKKGKNLQVLLILMILVMLITVL